MASAAYRGPVEESRRPQKPLDVCGRGSGACRHFAHDRRRDTEIQRGREDGVERESEEDEAYGVVAEVPVDKANGDEPQNQREPLTRQVVEDVPSKP